MTFDTLLYVVYAAMVLLFGIFSGGHALLHKRDPRAQLLWSGISFFVPILGPIYYWSFGVNRIQTRAKKWRQRGLFLGGREMAVHAASAARLTDAHPGMAEELQLLLQISKRVTGLPLLAHNHVRPLFNGDEAYPAMLGAIDKAERYVYLSSYLFEGDEAGMEFCDALIRAGERGVDVRVLVDAIGMKVGRRSIAHRLRNKKGVRFERFLPPSLSWRALRLHLRNHRKILVVDGREGFTGGMNIGSRNVLKSAPPKEATKDLHFHVTGPIVLALEEVFSEDWCFSVGKKDQWPEALPPAEWGPALCRGIKDGPNEDFEKLQWILIGALGCARTSVRILTPYFVPTRELLVALRTAVLRGATVELILPEKSNLRFVDWACNAHLPEVVSYGIRVYRQPAPFSHAKLLVVDDFYVNMGSANLDPRSLRLNFEFNVEIFEPATARVLSQFHQQIKETSQLVTRQSLEDRSLVLRLRDATAKLLSPYL